jgi:thiol-disulfide isomerase/thioredoxin
VAPAFAVPLPAGSIAPDFTRPGLNDKPVSLSAWHGKLVLLDFWASWCAPCIVELPHLIALQKSEAGRLQIIGVSMDDNKASALDVVKNYHPNYPVVMGDVALAKLYGGVLGLPEALLIGRDGKVLKSWRGDFKPGDLDAAIRVALSRP